MSNMAGALRETGLLDLGGGCIERQVLFDLGGGCIERQGLFDLSGGCIERGRDCSILAAVALREAETV